MVRSKTSFLIAARRGALRRAGTMASRSAMIRAVGARELRTNSIVGMRLRRGSPARTLGASAVRVDAPTSLRSIRFSMVHKPKERQRAQRPGYSALTIGINSASVY